MIEKYYTINEYGESELIIQKSRFIGYAKRVESEKEAQDFIHSIKKKHYDATHNCSAYLIGDHDEIQKANDDGEPGGTAGVPILEVIKKKDLKYTVIVVTRYFGGIKLGAGGLIRAYSAAASQVIEETGKIEKKLVQEFLVKIEYTFLGKIQNDINETDFILDKIYFENLVTLSIMVDVGKEEGFKSWIINLTSNQALIKEKDKLYLEVIKK
ncbi:MAG: YigZ family protein [Clostridia bacterium]|nr:YigZ family protein [Clostridia bacterium]